MAGEIEARLKALDLVLPAVAAPVADYVSFLHLNGQLYVAGQLPLKDGKIAVSGTLGAGVDVAQGQEAAPALRAQYPRPGERPRSAISTASSRCMRLNGFVECGAWLHRSSQGDQRRLRADREGRSATRGQHTRIAVRLLVAAARRRRRDRRDLRGGLIGPRRMAGDALDWLKRPIAHRGLHDKDEASSKTAPRQSKRRSPAYARSRSTCNARETACRSYSTTRRLDRLTAATRGLVVAHDAAELCTIPLRSSKDRISRLRALRARRRTRTAHHRGQEQLGTRCPLLRLTLPSLLRIMAARSQSCPSIRICSPPSAACRQACRAVSSPSGSRISAIGGMSPLRRFAMRHLSTAAIARPNFIAYDVRGFPALAPTIARSICPVCRCSPGPCAARPTGKRRSATPMP